MLEIAQHISLKIIVLNSWQRNIEEIICSREVESKQMEEKYWTTVFVEF